MRPAGKHLKKETASEERFSVAHFAYYIVLQIYLHNKVHCMFKLVAYTII